MNIFEAAQVRKPCEYCLPELIQVSVISISSSAIIDNLFFRMQSRVGSTQATVFLKLYVRIRLWLCVAATLTKKSCAKPAADLSSEFYAESKALSKKVNVHMLDMPFG